MIDMNYEFEKLHNFRDLGGLIGLGGNKVLPHRLLRAGSLANLTEHDVNILQNTYHLRHVIDLRTHDETIDDPDVHIPGTDYLALDFFPVRENDKATGSFEQLKAMRTKDEAKQMMKGLYASFITDSFVRKQIREILQVLITTPEGATLWHCSAGKDRAGITAAVILTILGVSKEDIMADYEATNKLRSDINKEILTGLNAKGLTKDMIEAVDMALCVAPEYLETCYLIAQEEYGSFEKYIINGIGFDESQWQQLRELYIE